MTFVSYHYTPGLFWFRIRGAGLLFKDTRQHKLLFSQRMGLKGLRIGWLYIEVLRKEVQKVKNKNPFTLIYYDSRMTQRQIEENNTRYWQYEIEKNGFRCP